jgi:hypothetical protein
MESIAGTLNQAPKPRCKGCELGRPSILRTNHRVSGKTLGTVGLQTQSGVHGGHFCHGKGHCNPSKGDENASVDHGRRPAIEQCELESQGHSFPRAEYDDTEEDYGRQVDVPLNMTQSVSSGSSPFLEDATSSMSLLEASPGGE